MKKTVNLGRTTAFALPLIMAGGMAAAGGLAAPVETVAPTPYVAPAPVMMGSDWTGFYAGAQLGYGKLDPNVVTDPTEPDGAVYGVHAGYMYDLGSIVLGAELDYDATNISIDAPVASDLDSVARAKLRLGYDAGAFLPYITAGAARATTTNALDGDTDGNFAGLGVVYKMNNILIGGEVLRHQFEDVAGSPGLDVDATTATARVSFQF